MPDDNDEQIKRRYKKAVLDEKIRRAAREEVDKNPDRPKVQLIIRKASEVPDEPLITAFGNRFVQGAFQLVVGPGEAGKGMLSVDIISRITTGEPWPDEPPKTRWRDPAAVMVCVTEDSESRVKGRLQAAGADLDRVHFINGPETFRGGLIVPSPVALDEDAGALVEAARDLKAVALFLETTVEHMGDRSGKKQPSTNNESEVRHALAPAIAACREAKLIGWGVMHPRKSMEGGIEDSISGSAGFRNIGRSILHVYGDPKDESDERWRLFCCSKANYLRRHPTTLRFRVEPWEKDPREGRVVWGIYGKTLFDQRSAEEIWEQIQERRSRRTRRDRSVVEAEAFLEKQLATGPVPQKELKLRAQQEGIDWRSVERAKSNMARVVASRTGFQSPSIWELMPEDEEGAP